MSISTIGCLVLWMSHFHVTLGPSSFQWWSRGQVAAGCHVTCLYCDLRICCQISAKQMLHDTSYHSNFPTLHNSKSIGNTRECAAKNRNDAFPVVFLCQCPSGRSIRCSTMNLSMHVVQMHFGFWIHFRMTYQRKHRWMNALVSIESLPRVLALQPSRYASMEPDWRMLPSASSASLCAQMLSWDLKSRPSAAECLHHSWLSAEDSHDVEIPMEALGNLLLLDCR